ncbi:MAG TPA: hypothetical protein VH268_13185, partial [Solirubrobacterales bacterium]|nr:hypothetical protein [Solirubrobacterales bacterium]
RRSSAPSSRDAQEVEDRRDEDHRVETDQEPSADGELTLQLARLIPVAARTMGRESIQVLRFESVHRTIEAPRAARFKRRYRTV